MKLLTASLTALALVASPVFAQDTSNTTASDQKTATTTNVKSTTRHVHATNVPVRHHSARHHTKRHHAVRCGCPATHKAHHAKTHHVKKTTATTTTTKS